MLRLLGSLGLFTGLFCALLFVSKNLNTVYGMGSVLTYSARDGCSFLVPNFDVDVVSAFICLAQVDLNHSHCRRFRTLPDFLIHFLF